jgi:hypothetical protein
MMQAARSSETSVTNHYTTRRHNPEDHGSHLHHRKNFKTHKFDAVRTCTIENYGSIRRKEAEGKVIPVL